MVVVVALELMMTGVVVGLLGDRTTRKGLTRRKVFGQVVWGLGGNALLVPAMVVVVLHQRQRQRRLRKDSSKLPPPSRFQLVYRRPVVAQ